MRQNSAQRMACLVTAAVAAAVLSTPCLAYNFCKKNSSELNFDIKNFLGAFYSEESTTLVPRPGLAVPNDSSDTSTHTQLITASPFN